MFGIKKIALIIVILIAGISIFFGTSYALWRHNTEVKFNLTISEPEEEDESDYCVCGTYNTIQEGIDILRDIQYPRIYNRMDTFENQLCDRISEINDLPYGSITLPELKEERDYYMGIIDELGSCVRTYGSCCIKGLEKFYKKATKEEQNQVPDFWTQHSELWDLSNQLWSKRNELYDAINAFWEAGLRKINFDHN